MLILIYIDFIYNLQQYYISLINMVKVCFYAYDITSFMIQ